MSRNRIIPTKPRDFVAKDLRTPKYRMRVVTSKKAYDRKKFDKKEVHGEF
jgi:hypothetical protein